MGILLPTATSTSRSLFVFKVNCPNEDELNLRTSAELEASDFLERVTGGGGPLARLSGPVTDKNPTDFRSLGSLATFQGRACLGDIRL